MRVGRCATVGDKEQGGQGGALGDPGGDLEGVGTAEGGGRNGVASGRVREAGQGTHVPRPKTRRPNGAATCQPGQRLGCRAPQRHEPRKGGLAPASGREPCEGAPWILVGHRLIGTHRSVEERVFFQRGEGASDSAGTGLPRFLNPPFLHVPSRGGRRRWDKTATILRPSSGEAPASGGRRHAWGCDGIGGSLDSVPLRDLRAYETIDLGTDLRLVFEPVGANALR